MRHLSVRHRLYLLVLCSAAALVLVGACGWWSIQSIGAALHTITDRNLPAVSALAAMHTARLESARAMQDGVAFRPAQYDDMASRDDMIEEAHALFGDIIDTAKGANAAGEKAFATYDALPRSAAEEKLWAEVKTLWEGYRVADQWQMQLTEAMAGAEDWDAVTRGYSVFASHTVQWTGVVNRLAPLLRELSALNVAAAEAARQAGDDTVLRMRATMLTIIAVALVAVCALGLLVARSVVAALQAIRSTIAEVSESNDFTLRAAVRGRDEAAQTATAFNLLLENVRRSLQAVVATTATVSKAAGQALSVSREVAASAVEQSESATAMATAIEQMTVSIGHIATSTQEAADRARDASGAADAGADNVLRTAGEMEGVAQEITRAGDTVAALGRESDRISKIADVIKEVAEQTNLLALNAAIEAARAGEQGRGFAVVADEVRKLAERTTSSAQEIGQMVVAMQASARGAVGTVEAVVGRAQGGRTLSEQAAARIGEIRDSARRVTRSVDDVSAALSEQDRVAQDISRRIEAIARMSEAACATGERTAVVSRDLESAARELHESMQRFRV